MYDARQGDSLLIKHFLSLSLVFTISSPGMAQCVITQGVISQGRLKLWLSLLITLIRNQILLEVVNLSLPREREILDLKRKDAVSLLERIELQPSPEPTRDSIARMAFDPYITRRLFAFMPLRVLELPPQDSTWKALRSLFSGLEELYELTGTMNVTTWQVGSNTPGCTTPYSHVTSWRSWEMLKPGNVSTISS